MTSRLALLRWRLRPADWRTSVTGRTKSVFVRRITRCSGAREVMRACSLWHRIELGNCCATFIQLRAGMSAVNTDLRERALRLRREATGIREAAMSLSSDQDKELFLRHAAALDAEAARLEVQTSANDARERP